MEKMETIQGYSFIEIIITLILVMTVSLGLLQQQENLLSSFRQIQHRQIASLLLHNQAERIMARQPFAILPKMFTIQQDPGQFGEIILTLSWGYSLEEESAPCCWLQQSLGGVV